MTHLIDARVAWDLVCAVPPIGGAAGPVRVHHDPLPDVWLQVYPSGAWRASAPPTPDAAQLLSLYLPIQIAPDLVIAQAGQSLDGRIATVTGHSHYVTGPADITRLHRLRALVDAVVVGAGTVAADDPKLTVRAADGANPARIVIDPDGRLDRSRHVFRDGAAPTVTVRRGSGPAGDPTTIWIAAAGDGPLDPHAILDALRARGYRRVLIEGGGVTVSRFLDARAVDRLHVTVAPILIGSGRAAFTLAPVSTLDAAIRPACRTFQLGDDVLFDLELRRAPAG